MRYGIFSDIHGNLEAMESVIAAYQQEAIDRYFCLGDVVGYGANPHECIEAVKRLQAHCLAGNHEWAVLGKMAIDDFNSEAQAAIQWTQGHLSEGDREFLANLDLIYKDEKMLLVHGMPYEPERFHYLLNHTQAKIGFARMDREICFIGHSHIPGFFLEQPGAIHGVCLPEFCLEAKPRCMVNVGSIGQPRDGHPQASYCVYDIDQKTISIKRVDYDIKKAQQKIVAAGLPPLLAARLAWGQ